MFSRVRFALLAIILLSILPEISGATSIFNNIYCATPGVGAPGPTSVNNIADCINGAIPYIFIALLLSFAMVAFAYLLGEVLNMQAFKGWYKGELWEAIKSLLIVGVIFSIIVIFGQVASLLPGGQNIANPSGSTGGFDYLYNTAYEYFVGPTGSLTSATPAAAYSTTPGALSLVNESYNNILGISMGSELLIFSKEYTYFPIPLPPFPYPGASVYGSLDFGASILPFQTGTIDSDIHSSSNFETQAVSLLIIPMFIALGAQAYLFTTLIQIGLGILLPLGLIFRATPFLRSIGGTLIALSIAAVIIYPALLAFLNEPINYFFSPLYVPQFEAPISCPVSNLGVLECANIDTANLWPTTFFATLENTQFEQDELAYSSGFAAGENIFYAPSNNFSYLLTPLIGYLAPVVLQFVLLVLDLVIGITLAVNVAKILGGNIRLGIGKLKLA